MIRVNIDVLRISEIKWIGMGNFNSDDHYICIPYSSVVKEFACQYRRHEFYPWVRKIPWSRKWKHAPVFLPGNSMDWRPWRATVHGVTKSQKRLSMHTHEHYIYYCGRKSLRRNGVVLISTRVQNAVPACHLKNDRMISVCFQVKPFNFTVTQVYAPTSDAEKA